MKKIICLFLLFLFSFQNIMSQRITGKSFATRSEVIARNGMAATSQPLATQVALDILKQGGSAIDAAMSSRIRTGCVMLGRPRLRRFHRWGGRRMEFGPAFAQVAHDFDGAIDVRRTVGHVAHDQFIEHIAV